MNARYEEWSVVTAFVRESVEAKAELKRRGLSQQPARQLSEPASEPPTTAGWWQQFEADLAGAERALKREHQTAIAAGHPWPPSREQKPQARAVIDLEPDGQAARLDELLGHAAGAAERLAAENAGNEARAKYSARIDREAQAESGPTLQAQVQDQAEAEP